MNTRMLFAGWLLGVCAALLMLGTPSHGQTCTTPNYLGPIFQGEPVVALGTGATCTANEALSSPLVLDATQFSGTPDACKQINTAISAMLALSPANGVVDARGFTGDQKCQTNMFPAPTMSYPVVTGKLLLGNVVLHSTKTQIQPSKFQVEGAGWTNNTAQWLGSGNYTNPSPDTNSVVRACVSGETDCGTTNLCQPSCGAAILWCWGTDGPTATAGTRPRTMRMAH